MSEKIFYVDPAGTVYDHLPELVEFRCPIPTCHKLQCRVSPDSVVERKCKCKALIVYDKGEVRVLSPKG